MLSIYLYIYPKCITVIQTNYDTGYKVIGWKLWSLEINKAKGICQTPIPGQTWELTLLLCGNDNKKPHPEGAEVGF
jgi:hypothetical protein